MQNTKHYNLKKPDANDYYSVNDSNSNMDIIDEELNKLSESNKKTQETINNFIEGETSEKIKASNVSIQDIGNNFDSSDVEGALQEVMEEVKKALQNGVDIKDAVRDAINSKLTVPDLPSNATWNDIINAIIQIKEGRGNAQPGDVLQGKTFTNDSGQELTGTMPNRGSGGTVTPSTSNQTKPKGYYSSDIVIAGSSNLVASNIKKNVNIFGVTGNVIQATGNAQASQVLSGATFSNSSGSGTGTIPNRGGARTITPSTTNQTLSAGYYSGNITVAGSGNLIAGNIRSGINIFGVNGSLKDYKEQTITYNIPSITTSTQVKNLTVDIPLNTSIKDIRGVVGYLYQVFYYNPNVTQLSSINLFVSKSFTSPTIVHNIKFQLSILNSNTLRLNIYPTMDSVTAYVKLSPQITLYLYGN